MAKVTCAISGIRFDCSFLESLSVPANEGYPHPIFAAPRTYLDKLYSLHTRGELPPTDSYLLFIAYLHSSDKIVWNSPATCNPNDASTKQMVENNLSQLLRVMHKTAAIQHPRFTQPSFRVTYENSGLKQIANWIKAWEENISYFYTGRADEAEQEILQRVENKLTALILGGESPERYAGVIADWASKAAEFPPAVAAEWRAVICKCFNITAMFNTPLTKLTEIKEYCESNIEVGSIHFHTLHKVIKEGIGRHVDYLGGSSLALGYKLLPTSSDGAGLQEPINLADREKAAKSQEDLLRIATNAPKQAPIATDYSSNLEFLKAKMAFRIAANAKAEAQAEEVRLQLKAKLAASNTGGK